MRSALIRFAALALVAIPVQSTADPTSWAGQALSDYLDALNDQGLRIIYTSDLVTGNMRLDTEPDPDNPAATLAAVLRPHGLAVTEGPAGSLLVVRSTTAAPAPVPHKEQTIIPIPEIVVSSSLHRLDYSHPATHTHLDRELATRIPTTAEEAVRLTDRLPGTANGGVSARNYVRGGEANEVLFLFDGLRLYEPYHMKDFQQIATIVNSNAIAGMDFYAGAFPASYGDRMSGVLSMDLRKPEKPVETEIALSFFNASLLSLGTLGDSEQGEWLLSARRGNLDLIVDLVDPDFGSPDYHDYLGHFGWDFGPRLRLSANFLISSDNIELADRERGEQASASYTNQATWAKWDADWTDSLSSATILAFSDIDDRRSGALDLPGIVSGNLDERQDFSVAQFRQDWQWIVSTNWLLRFGIDYKDLEAKYRVASQKTLQPPFDAILDNVPSTTLDLALDPDGAQYAAYTEVRYRADRYWTLDLGIRWDQQNYTTAADDKQYSPRVSLLLTPTDRTELRLGWGQFYQAQEINELDVSDGQSDYFPAQRAEHLVLNLQHSFTGSGIDASLSVYHKKFHTLRPRFENSFNALTLLPELQFDRVRVDAGKAEAVGAELTLIRGSSDEDFLWWLGYAWSEVRDDIGDRQVARSWDQTHTVKGGLSWRWSSWDFSAAFEMHTGWPRTTMTGELLRAPDGGSELVLDVGDRNALRHSVFHSLDIRVSREFELARSKLTAFMEITNLYDRSNPCCTEYSLLPDGSLASRESHWLPLVPSLGVVWRF